MSLVSAMVEANGWVLAVRHAAPVLTTAQRDFGSETGDHPLFPLDPSGAPKISVTQTGLAGFARSGGQAVAAMVAGMPAVGVKPLRTVYGATPPGSTQTTSYLDQADHGDGTVTVRIALSERVMAGAAVTASFAAGWRQGLGGGVLDTASGKLINASTRQPVPPIVRHAMPNLRLVRGTAAAASSTAVLESIVASHYARHAGGALHQAVAAVRYAVSDGVTLKFFWFTAPSTSGQYGDNCLVWGGEVDLAGLNAGVLTVHRSVFPWIGTARHTCGTDPAGMTAAALHSTDLAAGFAATSDRPAHLCYDPLGTRYPIAVVVVAPSGGSVDTTAAGITVGTGTDRTAALAAARGGTKAASLTAAIQRISVANRQLVASNGFAAASNCVDWAEIVFEAGTHGGPGGTAVGTNAKTAEGRLMLTGEAGAILQPGATVPNLRASRFWVSGLVLEHSGTASYASSTSAIWHLHNCTFRGAAGAEAGTSNLVSGGPTGIGAWLSATQTVWWRYGVGMAGSNQRFSLIRGCTTAREAQALALIHVEQVIDATVSYPGGLGYGPDSFGGWPADTADQMAWGCVALRNNGRFYNPGRSAPSGGTGADPTTYTRYALVNCLSVRANNATDYKFVQSGESANNQTQDSLIEGCSFIGQRMNWHNDPPAATDNLRHTGNTFRANYFDRLSSKSDTFPTASANRTGSWEFHYGVGFRDNVIGERGGLGSDQFTLQSYGLNTVRNAPAPGPGTASIAQFVNDQSNWSPSASNPGIDGIGSASGDYRVLPTSPMNGRAAGAVSAATLLGGGARGTLAGAAAGLGGVWAASATSFQRAAGSSLGWRGMVGAAAARQSHAVGAARLGVTTAVPAAGAAQAFVGTICGLSVRVALAPLRSFAGSRAAEPVVRAEVALRPAGAESRIELAGGAVAWVGRLSGGGGALRMTGTPALAVAAFTLMPEVGTMGLGAGAGALDGAMNWMPAARVRRVAAEARIRRA